MSGVFFCLFTDFIYWPLIDRGMAHAWGVHVVRSLLTRNSVVFLATEISIAKKITIGNYIIVSWMFFKMFVVNMRKVLLLCWYGFCWMESSVRPPTQFQTNGIQKINKQWKNSNDGQTIKLFSMINFQYLIFSLVST